MFIALKRVLSEQEGFYNFSEHHLVDIKHRPNMEGECLLFQSAVSGIFAYTICVADVIGYGPMKPLIANLSHRELSLVAFTLQPSSVSTYSPIVPSVFVMWP